MSPCEHSRKQMHHIDARLDAPCEPIAWTGERLRAGERTRAASARRRACVTPCQCNSEPVALACARVGTVGEGALVRRQRTRRRAWAGS